MEKPWMKWNLFQFSDIFYFSIRFNLLFPSIIIFLFIFIIFADIALAWKTTSIYIYKFSSLTFLDFFNFIIPRSFLFKFFFPQLGNINIFLASLQQSVDPRGECTDNFLGFLSQKKKYTLTLCVLFIVAPSRVI